MNKTDCYFHKMIMKIQLIMRDAICNGNKKTLTSRYPCCSLCFCKNNFELLPCEVRIFFLRQVMVINFNNRLVNKTDLIFWTVNSVLSDMLTAALPALCDCSPAMSCTGTFVYCFNTVCVLF